MDVVRSAALARERYGLLASSSELPSYADQNFRLQDASGARYVLKISRAGQPRGELELEDAALAHLEALGFPAPRVVPDAEGRRLSALDDHWVRLLTWIEGRPLAEVARPGALLLDSLGRHLGELDRSLASFDHPSARRHLRWDLRHACEVEPLLASQPDRKRRARVERTLTCFATDVLPRLDAAPRGVIHNDANDWNVLVEPRDGTRVAGMVDFGDMVHTAVVCEPAIAMTYAMLDDPAPLLAARRVLAGYHATRPLAADERQLLLDLIEARLCVSVTISAHERARAPDNEYLGVTEPHAWRLLDWLDGQPRDELQRDLDEVCGEATR